MKDTQLKYWLANKGCLITAKSDREKTHTSMDGAVLSVSREYILEFYMQYATGLRQNESYYICERPSKVCKMFCDFDFMQSKEVKLKEFVNYVDILTKAINILFNNEYNVMILRAPSKLIESNNEDEEDITKIKSGYHLIWPEVYVELRMAKLLRAIFVELLGHENNEYDWDSILDPQVYSSGLRFMGSRKFKREKIKTDDLSPRKTKKYNEIIENRPYKFIQFYPENGKEVYDGYGILFDEKKRTVKDDCQLLNLAAIRTYFYEENLIIDSESHVIQQQQEEQEEKDYCRSKFIFDLYKKKKDTFLKKSKRSSLNTEKNDSKKDYLVDTDNLETILEHIIGTYTIAEWKGIHVSIPDEPEVQEKKTNKKKEEEHLPDNENSMIPSYYIVNAKSHFCLNLKKDHNSNHIYFRVYPTAIYQLCFCRCKDSDKKSVNGVLCKDFISSPFTYPFEYKEKLFPNLTFNDICQLKIQFNMTVDKYEHQIKHFDKFTSNKYKRRTRKKKKEDLKNLVNTGNNLFPPTLLAYSDQDHYLESSANTLEYLANKLCFKFDKNLLLKDGK